jgi:hypothetical protein
MIYLACLLAFEALDFDMTPQEKKKTGVVKLTEKEKAALEHWIENRYAKREAPLNDPIDKPHPRIEDNLEGGRRIRLSDRSVWVIAPSDLAIAQGWITPVSMIIRRSEDKEFPYLLVNGLTGSFVKAKRE